MAEVEDFIPSRVIRHGVHFDFIASVENRALSEDERASLLAVVRDELEASRRLHGLFLDRTRKRDRCRILHRKLMLD